MKTMKKLNLYVLAVLVAMIPVMQSCNDDDKYSSGNFVFRMATVHVISGETYYLEIDNGKTLWPSVTKILGYKPIDGQRVLADYTPLGHLESYDEAVRVNYLFNILTKQVEELTAGNEAEYGDDPVHIEKMWLGANFLNIQFLFNIPSYKAHRVSLVQNTTTGKPLIDEDGYINLEYRYNTYDDVSPYGRRSFVSYNLGEYGPLSETLDEGVVGLKVRINSAVNGEKEIVLTYVNRSNETLSFDYSDDVTLDGVE